MASCPGKKGTSTCYGILHRCKKCGNVGCDQTSAGKCTNQGFTSSRCAKCAAIGQKEAFR